jgi:hypothetical protein
LEKKAMKGIDPKWVVFLGIALMIEQGIGQGSVSLTNVVPPDWIPYVKGWSALLAFIGTTVMTGMSAYSSNTTGVMIPTPSIPPAVKMLIGFLIIGLALSFAMPAHAQNGTVSFSKVKLKPLSQIIKPTPAPAPVAATPTSNPLDAINDVLTTIGNVNVTIITNTVAALQAADADAGTIVTAAIPATAAVPAVLAADGVTVVTPAVPANPGTPAVVKDPISHACYPAQIQFLYSLPQVQSTNIPAPYNLIPLFQFKRDIVNMILAGSLLPPYLKVGCAALLGQEITILVGTLGLVGVGATTLAPLTALAGTLTAGLGAAAVALPVLTLIPK